MESCWENLTRVGLIDQDNMGYINQEWGRWGLIECRMYHEWAVDGKLLEEIDTSWTYRWLIRSSPLMRFDVKLSYPLTYWFIIDYIAVQGYTYGIWYIQLIITSLLEQERPSRNDWCEFVAPGLSIVTLSWIMKPLEERDVSPLNADSSDWLYNGALELPHSDKSIGWINALLILNALILVSMLT